jgi:acyl-homoserine-lactone acylase
VQWGTVHNIVLVTHDSTFQNTKTLAIAPQFGADDRFGPLRVIFPFLAPDGIHYGAASGDSYVQVVEFAKEGAIAQALLGYGNASRPGSPHITDQLSYFEAKTLRPTFRTRDEVERNKVSRECVPAPCGFSR